MSFQLIGNAPDIYEKVMVPLWFDHWASSLLGLVSLKPGERVLDVACGTGVTTRIARREVGKNGHVTGLDINAGMLTKASELASDLDINWMQSDVVDTRILSSTFNVIISQQGYQYFPDQAAALKEFLRILAPSGRIAMSTWDGHSDYTAALCNALEKFISIEIAEKQRSQRETPSATTLVEDLSDAGFQNVSVIRQELDIAVPLPAEFVPLHLGAMPIASVFQSLPEDLQEALIDEVSHSMRGHIVDDQMVYKDAVNVVIGVK